ncbi:PEP-CTERM sorting domain-containing protein [Botrimarina mediterranea]|uniref:PEP-CTERM sorting domain-containing protein n=1 Tax=Botrimarina mediterranea TaxID=2528022 RepID=UPI0011A7CCBB
MKVTRLIYTALVAAAALSPSVSLAAFVSPNLPGNADYDGWDDLTAAANPGYSGFPGTGAWPAPIGSNAAGSGDAFLEKVANGTGGGPYPAGGSMYYGGFSGDINNDGGTLAVGDATPVAGLANIVFQIEMGEAWTYAFKDNVLPTLNYNGGAQALAATTSGVIEKLFNGTVAMPTGEEDVFINTYLLQWDVSSLGPITDFEVTFTGVQHGQLYGLQLDQSDAYQVVDADFITPVPEPSTLVFGVIGAALLATGRRRRG